MGRQSCFVKPKLRKGLWSPEEDEKLFNHITRFGVGCWSTVPKQAGLQRCGKSCRLRWINYLRPDLKRGMFSQQEEDLIISLHQALGNRWAQIAAQLPGRTDNEIKNFWNSSLKKKLMKQGIDPNTHKPLTEAELRDGKSNYAEKSSLDLTQLRGIPISSSASTEMELPFSTSFCGGGILTGTSRERIENKPVFDPMLLYDFQSGVDPTRYSSNLLSHYQQQTPKPYHLEVNGLNPIFGFTSMPSLTNFDHHVSTAETGFSDNSTSRMSSILSKECSSNGTSHNGFPISNMMENNVTTYSWANDKLESMFQSQFSGIEMKTSPWSEGQIQAHSSDDFSTFPLTSLSEDLTGTTMDVFQHI